MTVWASSQPTRGLLDERSLFRLLGTIIGVIFGVFLVWNFAGTPLVIIFGLALWVGFCVWLGNLLRGFVSYGAMLAGYSAAMVVLLDTGQPGSILHLGIDRLLTVGLGVAIALLVGLVFTPDDAEGTVVTRIRLLTVQVLRLLEMRLCNNTAHPATFYTLANCSC